MAAARRGLLRIVPAARRDWVEAVWAETPQVPPGPGRLAWRAGGLWLLAREALMGRGTGRAGLFAAAAALMTWAAWPGSAGGFATAVDRVDLIAVVASLAGLGLAARWLVGPAGPGTTARLLRAATYAGILVLIPAKNAVEQVLDARPPQGGVYVRLYRLIAGPGFGNHWPNEITFLVVIALYAGAILWLTSQRARVDQATLVIGTVAGGVLGMAWYVAGPLGFGGAPATNPWLPGSDATPVLVLAAGAVLGAPVVAAILVGRRCLAAASPAPSRRATVRQVSAAALLTSLTGGLFVLVAGTGTIAAMLTAPWLQTAIYRGHPLSGVAGLRFLVHGNPAALSYSHQITAAMDAPPFLVLCMLFPVAGLAVCGIAYLIERTSTVPPAPGRGGPPGSGPVPPSGEPPGLAIARPGGHQVPAGTAG
jgi:hypothetical protein